MKFNNGIFNHFSFCRLLSTYQNINYWLKPETDGKVVILSESEAFLFPKRSTFPLDDFKLKSQEVWVDPKEVGRKVLRMAKPMIKLTKEDEELIISTTVHWSGNFRRQSFTFFRLIKIFFGQVIIWYDFIVLVLDHWVVNFQTTN